MNLAEFEAENGQYCVVANLPYYITTPLITKLLEDGKKCKSLAVMVQEEVAERLCAKENTPEYGAITAVVAYRARAEIIRGCRGRCLRPAPTLTVRWCF